MRISAGRKKIRLGDLLVAAGAITEEELQEAIAYQKEKGVKLGQAMVFGEVTSIQCGQSD